MQPLQLLTLLRTICNDTIRACEIGEYKSAVIFNIHYEKLQNVNNRVARDPNLNRNVKLKFFKEINKVYLAPTRIKDYTLMGNELKSKLQTLTSAAAFVKR